MLQQLALEAILMFIGKILGSDVFDRMEAAVIEYFDEKFDNMAGWQKFDAVFGRILPMVGASLRMFVEGGIKFLYFKHSPKYPQVGADVNDKDIARSVLDEI